MKLIHSLAKNFTSLSFLRASFTPALTSHQNNRRNFCENVQLNANNKNNTRNTFYNASGLPKARYGGRHTVTLLTGDGIGAEMLQYVRQIFRISGIPVDFELIELTKGSSEQRFQEALLAVRRNGVAIKGNLESLEDEGSKNLRLRTELDLFAFVQRCKNLPGIPMRHQNVDFVVIRENTEGEYSSLEHQNVKGVVESLKIITAAKSERIARYAFDYAHRHNRKLVTAVHKANIMKLADGLFLESCRKISKQYPNIEFNSMIVDNCSMQLVSNPGQFDVMVMPNLYGNVVGNIGAGLVGGAGMTSGMNIGVECALFESGTRNSGSSLVGKDVANPVAILHTACDMLDYLGLLHESIRIRNAVISVVSERAIRTRDIGGENATSEVISAIVKHLEQF